MSTEPVGNPDGPMSILDAVEAIYPDAEEAQPDAEAEAAPDAEDEAQADAEPGENPEEATAEPDEEAEDAGEDEPAEDDEAPQHLDLEEYGDLTVTVKVNGEERAVSLSEAAQGYQLTADYTRKTQALADERKAFDAERQQVAEHLNRQQEQVAQLLAETIGEPPSLEMAEEDPFEYTRLKAQYDQKVGKIQEMQQQRAQHQQQQIQEMGKAEAAKLLEVAPEFKDKAFTDKLVSTLTDDYGIAAEEVMATVDHRMFLLARDAMRYRQSVKKNPKVEKALRKPAKVVKPGQARTRAETDASKRAAKEKKLARSGGVSVEEYLDAKFG